MIEIKRLITIFLVFILVVSKAQDKLAIQGESPTFYVVHTVKAKESWYSLGRLYNLSPKELATYNGTSLETTLKINQELKVPLLASNFCQNLDKGPEESLVPLYHEMKEKEWMYRVSVQYNKVPIESLEKWNKIKSGQIKPGLMLVVGFLKVKSSQSALASQSFGNDLSITSSEKQEITNATKPPLPTVKPVDTAKPGTSAFPSTESGPVSDAVTINFKGGVFKKQYTDSGNQLGGNSGVFKSTSGWNDGKYYALIDGVPVGAIIKVAFSSTNKTIFAKVLGGLPDMKESQGLLMRLSDAAAAELGIANAKFFVEVRY